MRALITGATGFLGAATVARARAEGIIVRALVRNGGTPTEADEHCIGDLRDPESLVRAVTGVDVVVHAGARVSTNGTWEEFDGVNVQGTEALIRCAWAAGVRRVVHVSSLSVYAVPHDGATITEDSPYEEAADERGFYARSKLAADRVASAAIRAGAPVTIVRPGLLYGPSRRPPLARRSIALGSFRLLMASRDYQLPLAYVENVADAIVLAAQREVAQGRAYTIVDVHARQAEYADLFRRVSGARWRAVYIPGGPLRAAAAVAERLAGVVGRRPPITRHQVERTLRSATFSTRRAQEELGWQPRVSLEEGLRRAFGVRSAVPPTAAGAGVQSPA